MPGPSSLQPARHDAPSDRLPSERPATTAGTDADDAPSTRATEAARTARQTEAALADTAIAGPAPTLPLPARPPVSLDSPATGVLSADGSGIQVRTRVNADLPEPVQDLDRSLQLSRRSVFVDLAERRGPARLPDLVRRRLHDQDSVGRYLVNDEIASGGMGSVLAIADNDFQRQAAMKIMRGRYLDDPEALERFLDEARITAQLEHPNIVPVHDLGVTADGTIYYTMQRIGGESLGSIVRRLRDGHAATQAAWPVEQLLLTFLKVLDGVGYAHDRGVVHRDLKPDNIMVDAHGAVMVVDWGLAKVVGTPAQRRKDSDAGDAATVTSVRSTWEDAATLTGAVLGTPYYMPPEQARGDQPRVGPASDIYALGATLYELLSYRRPLPKGRLRELVPRILAGDITPLREQAPWLPDDLIAIVERAMAADQGARYPDCAAFAADLRAYLAGAAVSARRRRWPERLAAWLVRHRRQVLLGLAALVLILVSTGVTVWHYDQDRRQRGTTFLHAAEAGLAAWPEVSATAGTTAGEAALAAIADDLAAAAGLLGDRAHIGALRQRLADTRRAWQRQRDLAARQAQAGALIDQARAALSSEAVDGLARLQADCAERLASEVAFLPEAQLVALQTLQRELGTRLSELRARERRQLAETQRGRGRAALLQAEERWQAIAVAGATEERIAALRSSLDQARLALQRAMEQEALPGLQADIAEVGALRDRLDQRLQADARQDERRARATTALAAARRALAADRLDEAAQQLQLVRQSDAQIAGVEALTDELDERRQAAAAAEARAAEHRRQEQRQQQAWRETERAAAAWQTANEQLKTVQATAGSDGLAAYDAAQQAAATWRRHAAELYRTAETTWRLDPDSTYGRQARAQLAAVAHARLQRAVGEQDWSAWHLAMQQLRRWAPDHPALPPSGDRTRLHYSGPSPRGWRPVDAALQPLGEWRPWPEVGVLAFDGERLALAREDRTITVFVPAGQERRLTWPATTPSVEPIAGAALDLAWVPAAPDGRPGFWFGREEITMRQWYAFLQDPVTRAEMDAALPAIETGGLQRIPYRPATTTRQSDTLITAEFTVDGQRLKDFVLPPALAELPVTGITRPEAQAFCAWLSRRSGRAIRLPTAAEWRRAASGSDPARRYPWGPTYPAGADLAYHHDRHGPAAVADSGLDRGPYGHRDLAGNVREWLADDPPGPFDAQVAGGSWASGTLDHFRCDQTEALPADSASQQIGFRVVVESGEDEHPTEP